jgi:hypothetical protein
MSELDTLETADLLKMAFSLQGPGCCWRRSEDILRLARKRRDLQRIVIPTLFWTSLSQGKARDAIAWLNDPEMPEAFKPIGLYALQNRGVVIPRQQLDSALALQRTDSSDALVSSLPESTPPIESAGTITLHRWQSWARWLSVRGPPVIPRGPTSRRPPTQQFKGTDGGAGATEIPHCGCSSRPNDSPPVMAGSRTSTSFSAGG